MAGGNFDRLYGSSPEVLEEAEKISAVALIAVDRFYSRLTRQAFELRERDEHPIVAKRAERKETATYLGVDLGGTKLLIGEMNHGGEVLWSKCYPSGPLSQRQVLTLIEESVADYLETSRPKEAPLPIAMGVGLVGRV
ncbi:MAG: hypothetical protein LUH58_06410, partial [Lachnospiraceae bacterium]|nr:hypothetical protein [Lachnospiraceae bacterium]